MATYDAIIIGTWQAGGQRGDCNGRGAYAKAPYTVIEWAVHIHPTIAEFIPSLLQDLAPLRAEPGNDQRG